MVKRKIEYVNGVSNWLGYADSHFSIIDYFKIIHPRYADLLMMSAKSAIKTANSGNFELKFMEQHLVIQIPLLNADGKYILTKRTLYPFQIDKNGKILAYLNHFVVLKEYSELNVLDLRVGNRTKIDTNLEAEALKTIQSETLKKTEKPFGFSKKEIDILRLIAQNTNITHQEISERLGLNINSLKKTHNYRILKNAREYFKISAFSSIKEVAIYLKENNVFGKFEPKS
ncbi:MAG: winged helix-turn-helix transcriptional regulator [Emticicia sp.]|nr:winged helix-turn-helix transcriptional regulator [Emticicia sp.]